MAIWQQPPILGLLSQLRTQGQAGLALLIDPDNADTTSLERRVALAHEVGVSLLLVGGSLITGEDMGPTLSRLRSLTSLPLVIFPGSFHHIEPEADGILLLSLVSGRNPDFLIGQHVVAAPLLKRSGLQILSTAYMLVDGGRATTVSYVSNTQPLPADKPSIAACTALAAEMMGMQLVYLDGGSGAQTPVPPRMIAAVRKECTLPMIVGGGIRTAEEALRAWEAGADLIVIGNAAEERHTVIAQIGQAARELNARRAGAYFRG